MEKEQPNLRFKPIAGTMPVLQFCLPSQLEADPEYQRTLDSKNSVILIRRIAVNWDWSLCQPLYVARRPDGRLFVVDGQHRLEAAKLRGDIQQLPCVVGDFGTIALEAATFVALNQQRMPLSKPQLFHAAVASGDPEAVGIARVVAKIGMKIGLSSNNHAMKPGTVNNIGGLQHCYRAHGEKVLELALRSLRDAYPSETLRYAGSLFPGLVAVVNDQLALRGEPDDIVAKLTKLTSTKRQGHWYGAIAQVRAEDPNLTTRRGAEAVFIRAWRAAGEPTLVRPLPPPVKAGPVDAPQFIKAPPLPKPVEAKREWCDQCQANVTPAVVQTCKSQFCSLKQRA